MNRGDARSFFLVFLFDFPFLICATAVACIYNQQPVSLPTNRLTDTGWRRGLLGQRQRLWQFYSDIFAYKHFRCFVTSMCVHVLLTERQSVRCCNKIWFLLHSFLFSFRVRFGVFFFTAATGFLTAFLIWFYIIFYASTYMSIFFCCCCWLLTVLTAIQDNDCRRLSVVSCSHMWLPHQCTVKKIFFFFEIHRWLWKLEVLVFLYK